MEVDDNATTTTATTTGTLVFATEEILDLDLDSNSVTPKTTKRSSRGHGLDFVSPVAAVPASPPALRMSSNTPPLTLSGSSLPLSLDSMKSLGSLSSISPVCSPRELLTASFFSVKNFILGSFLVSLLIFLLCFILFLLAFSSFFPSSSLSLSIFHSLPVPLISTSPSSASSLRSSSSSASPLLRGPQDCVVLYQIPSATSLLRHSLLSSMNSHSIPSFEVLASPSTEKSPSLEDWPMETQESLLRAKLVYGNFTFGFHEDLAALKKKNIAATPDSLSRKNAEDQDHEEEMFSMTLVTMLRNPVDRVVSDLVHSKHPVHTWQDCVSKGAGSCRKYSNDMVRRLSGQFPSSWYHQTEAEDNSQDQGIKRPTPSSALFDASNPHSDRVLLEMAKRNLERFAVVGISERLQDTTRLLAAALGWPQMITNLQDIATNTRSVRSLPAELRHAIEERNRLDLELYQFALKLFEARLKAALSDSPKEQGQVQTASLGTVVPLAPFRTIQQQQMQEYLLQKSRSTSSGWFDWFFSLLRGAGIWGHNPLLFDRAMPGSHAAFYSSTGAANIATATASSWPSFFFGSTSKRLLLVAIGLGLSLGAFLGGGWIQVMLRKEKKKEDSKSRKRIEELDSANTCGSGTSTPTAPRRRTYKLTELC